MTASIEERVPELQRASIEGLDALDALPALLTSADASLAQPGNGRTELP
jgi:hypothetical protein